MLDLEKYLSGEALAPKRGIRTSTGPAELFNSLQPSQPERGIGVKMAGRD